VERRAHTECMLEKVGAFTRQYVRPAAGLQRHVALVQEFCEFLGAYGEAGCDSLNTCTDVEVLVFLQGHYLRNHQGRGQEEIAGSTLEKAVTQLRGAFAERCRVGPWMYPPGAVAPMGNPAHSLRVSQFVKSYQKYCSAIGIQERSAVPMSYSQYVVLMSGIEDEINEELERVACGQGSLPALLLLMRDAAAFALMWQSCRRGSDVLNVKWGGIFDGDSDVGVVQACEEGEVRDISETNKLFIIPQKTKTEQVGRAATQVIWRDPALGAVGCAVRVLAQYRNVLRIADVEVSRNEYVFISHRRAGDGAITVPALLHRFRRAVARHGVELVNAGRKLTLHSFRRGRLQHEAYVNDQSHDWLMRLSGIKDVGVLMRYLDEGRHLV
jgi:integrase